MSASGDDQDFGGEDPYAPNTASGVTEDDFAAPHYELDDESMAPVTGLNESDEEFQSADVTLVRIFLGSAFKGASESSFLTLRCLPGASVQAVKAQAMNKLKHRFPSEGTFEAAAYVLMSVPMPGLPQKRTQGGAKGECSDRDLALPEFVPFIEHFDSALVSEMQGHKVMYMRLEHRDKPAEAPAKEARVSTPGPSTLATPTAKVRLVRVAFREVDNGVTPGQGFLTLKCTEETTGKQIKAQALAKYNAKRIGGSPKTHSRSSQQHHDIEDDAELENYTLSLIAVPKTHSRSDSKTSDSVLGRSTTESLIKDDEKLYLRYPKTNVSPQVLEVLLTRRSTESSLSRTSMQREDSLRSAREDSTKRTSVHDDALMRYVFAATPSEEALSMREDSTKREEEFPAGDSVLLRVKFQAHGGYTEGFVTLKCEEGLSVTAVKEQALVKFTRRSSSGSMPVAKLDPNLFTLWRMEPTAISDENVNGAEVTFWKLFKIQKNSPPVQIQMVFSGSRKEEAVTHGSLDSFAEFPNAQVFIRHGVEEKGQQIQVWYGPAAGGRLGWGRTATESVLLADIKDIYLGSYWFPELFTASTHARRCFALEWSDLRGPGWLLLEAASSDALRKWIEGLYGLLMARKAGEQTGQFHQQCTLYHPVVKPK